MDKRRIKKLIRKWFRNYLRYIIIFAIVIFAIQKPKEIEEIKIFTNENYNRENINRDRVALVESGEDGALARINLLGNAKKTIDISYYTLIDDQSTEIILASILDAADRGVEVRVLLDGIFHNLKGNLKDTIYAFESHPNIKLKLYEPFNLAKPWAWNSRLHDKIILVDERLALIGGRNIGDKYFVEDIKGENFVRDRDVLIFKDESEGDFYSVINDMRNYYDKIWNYKYSKPAVKKMTWRKEEKGKAFKEDLKTNYTEYQLEYLKDLDDHHWHNNTIATEEITFVYNPIGRINKEPWSLRELYYLSSKAEDSIFIQSPYIIPSRNMKSKLRGYDIDFEKIKMLTNSLSSSPNPMGMAGYLNNREDLVDVGIELYEFQGPDSIHSKTYIFDNKITVVGSFNFDARSSYINTESMVIIKSEEFAEKLMENVQVDLDNSLKVAKDYSYVEDENIKEGEISFIKKTIVTALSKVTRLLEYLL